MNSKPGKRGTLETSESFLGIMEDDDELGRAVVPPLIPLWSEDVWHLGHPRTDAHLRPPMSVSVYLRSLERDLDLRNEIQRDPSGPHLSVITSLLSLDIELFESMDERCSGSEGPAWLAHVSV